MPIRVRAVPAAAVVLLAAAGCGGGGSSSSGTTPPPPPANLQSAPGVAALTAYLQAPHQNTLTATDSAGNSYVVQLTTTPNPGTTTFNGVANASSEVDALSLSKNGVPVASSSVTRYYVLSPYQPLGTAATSGSGTVGIDSAPGTIPATLTVGSSGPISTVTVYHDATLATVDAHETVTYTVTANNTKTLILCVNSNTTDVTAQGTADGLAVHSEADCYTDDAAGSVVLDHIVLTISGVTLTFK